MDRNNDAAKSDSGRPAGFFRRIGRGIARAWRKTYPGPAVRRGSALGLMAFIGVFVGFFGWYLRPGLPGLLDNLSGVLFFLIIVLLIGLLLRLFLKILFGLRRFLNPLGVVAWIALIVLMATFEFPFSAALLLGLTFGLAAVFLGGGLAALFDREFRFARPIKKLWITAKVLLPLGLVVLTLIWAGSRGDTDHLRELESVPAQASVLAAPNPGRPGTHEVLTLTYGSGTDHHRTEFGASADLKTGPVDATPFLKDSKGWKMKLRHWYWGFDFKAFPVNGRVWYPAGPGPFPLVLCVHGNHKMQEFSDPGYAYLGELLASRGFIFVSVDENFFNGTFLAGLSRENDGRGWMLLQHLKAWRSWNREEGNPFSGRVDMGRIGLIGHSRGGEAAAIAAGFNRLPRYPDDATVSFDFDFDIRAVVAIAPSDQQYKPADRPNPLENVNYLVLQGAHDADVSVFAGARQYQRVSFNDGKAWFKAALYSYRSNHGQFNTVWGDNDWGDPMGFMLNRRALLSGEDQRILGKVAISAFLEATLHGKTEYLALFRDPRTASDWLPEDIYISRFQDSSFRPVCTFEEDVDVTTGTTAGARIEGENLAVWRESDLRFRRGGTKQNHVVRLGWRGGSEERSGEMRPAYAIELPPDYAASAGLSLDSQLVFSLAEADEKVPEPDDDKSERDNQAAGAVSDRGGDPQADEEAEMGRDSRSTPPLELRIELMDADGVVSILPLDRFIPVPPIIRSRFTKLSNERGLLGKAYEPTLRTCELPLAAFSEAVPDFDPSRLRRVRFVFDRGREGVLVLDDLGFSPRPVSGKRR